MHTCLQASLAHVRVRNGLVYMCTHPAKFDNCMQVYALLNCDDHANYLKKHKKDPALYRPDICHQHEPDSSNLSSLRPVALCMLSALLAILDSPLCKAGKVKGIYVRTHKNVLIAISPKVCGRAQSGSSQGPSTWSHGGLSQMNPLSSPRISSAKEAKSGHVCSNKGYTQSAAL
eukprot:scaffold140042_cov23-Tisochrysis_lutea.AAC.1